MNQIIIYDIINENYMKVLPKLIDTIWNKGNKILIYTNLESEITDIDNILWSYNQLSFLPHLTCNDNLNNVTPVIISNNEINYNNANVIICLKNELSDFVKSFEKIIFVNKIQETYKKQIDDFIEHLLSVSSDVIRYSQNTSGAWQKIDREG